ncbi:hypothetical protein TPHA_0H02560 [Tetrapisispora phaffii CBS 4417]|uniref:N-acetyltransferase domain-containing protein n=1 Tax=Tetrapisispora phaffii (strain ATCC 24235 / CBS 4417 / NBRC 1672 / NRRL Y-8282 / UCD 70-5) TaxID=1071381 RepID=G8BWK8_TETPH|nr:hypothetical protein TPHA_0H02560 [Tetrapisispora phaffii CBS 4417]CCE64459.1 hypothetical protein TPHA_0H02560 [Tetrapisispora phaffii CBS 4417]
MSIQLNITDDVDRAADVLNNAFSPSHCSDFIFKKFFNISLDEKCSRARIKAIIHYYTALYHDLDGGDIVEVNDFDAVALFSTPGKHLPPTLTGDAKFDKEFITDISKRKKEVIPEGVPYYYLFMIGRDLKGPHKKGSVKKIFETYKEKADKDNAAIVLESIADHATSVYEYFGFKNYLTYTIGKGEVNSKGEPDSTGEGFTVKLMFYHKDGEKVLRP